MIKGIIGSIILFLMFYIPLFLVFRKEYGSRKAFWLVLGMILLACITSFLVVIIVLWMVSP